MLFEDIDQDIYDFYLDTYKNNGGDYVMAVAETSLYFMEDEDFIENIIESIENKEEEEEDA